MASFISVDDLGFYLRRDLSTDDLAPIVTDAASQVVREFLDLTLDETSAAAVVLDGTGTKWLLVPEIPVTDVVSVVLWAGTDSEETLVEGVDEDFVWYADGRIFRCGTIWPRDPYAVTVTYDFGYATVPSDIRLVALHLAARLYDHAGVDRENMGSVSLTYESSAVGLTDAERSVLAKRKKGRP